LRRTSERFPLFALDQNFFLKCAQIIVLIGEPEPADALKIVHPERLTAVYLGAASDILHLLSANPNGDILYAQSPLIDVNVIFGGVNLPGCVLHFFLHLIPSERVILLQEPLLKFVFSQECFCVVMLVIFFVPFVCLGQICDMASLHRSKLLVQNQGPRKRRHKDATLLDAAIARGPLPALVPPVMRIVVRLLARATLIVIGALRIVAVVLLAVSGARAALRAVRVLGAGAPPIFG
jgi:hypothetical protein